MSLPAWFQAEIPTELLRLARANVKKPAHRQILADWVERYGGEDGRVLCRFLRRDEVLRYDSSTWQTLSASEGRMVAPFSDLVLGIGDRLVLPLTETQNITMGWVPPGESWLDVGFGKRGTRPFNIKKGLWCGIYPVTQEQWLGVMGNNPSHSQGMPNNPVEQVSYVDVQVFLQKVNAANRQCGFLYRLPSADEWQYIIRGGPISRSQSLYDFYFANSHIDLDPVASNDLSSTQANFDGNYPCGAGIEGPYLDASSAVGNYLPNPLGMYDMHGNVSEWTSTQEKSGKVVICGGSWMAEGYCCKASSLEKYDQDIPGYREWYLPDALDIDLGFRILAVPLGD